ncbi:hypothetical protein BWZ20_00475 [Winogradskyella sp. J14-2]|nr:hypothetical protein BWZ20_00475 [Winogradskyella sp. J14-2]
MTKKENRGIRTLDKKLNPVLKSLLVKGFKYLYAFALFTFFISILMLVSYLGLKKEIDWNGALILYSILVPALLIFRIISKKLKKNVG